MGPPGLDGPDGTDGEKGEKGDKGCYCLSFFYSGLIDLFEVGFFPSDSKTF